MEDIRKNFEKSEEVNSIYNRYNLLKKQWEDEHEYIKEAILNILKDSEEITPLQEIRDKIDKKWDDANVHRAALWLAKKQEIFRYKIRNKVAYLHKDFLEVPYSELKTNFHDILEGKTDKKVKKESKKDIYEKISEDIKKWILQENIKYFKNEDLPKEIISTYSAEDINSSLKYLIELKCLNKAGYSKDLIYCVDINILKKKLSK